MLHCEITLLYYWQLPKNLALCLVRRRSTLEGEILQHLEIRSSRVECEVGENKNQSPIEREGLHSHALISWKIYVLIHCIRYCKLISSIACEAPELVERSNFWCKPRKEKHKLDTMTTKQLWNDDANEDDTALPFIEWTKDVPMVDTSTPETTPSRDIPSSRPTVSTP